MQLRNKKTGEIVTLNLTILGKDMYTHITKLSELKDYDDYEEPKRRQISYVAARQDISEAFLSAEKELNKRLKKQHNKEDSSIHGPYGPIGEENIGGESRRMQK